jgi:hypothetical protein
MTVPQAIDKRITAPSEGVNDFETLKVNLLE